MGSVIRLVRAGLVCAVVLSAMPALGQVTRMVHDPWLNWDIFNRTGSPSNDFHIIVENPGFNPNPNDPNQVFKGLFQSFQATTGEFDASHAGNETLLTWSNPAGGPIPAAGLAHIGLYMAGSGRILDAYWTLDGVPKTPKIPIIYELTWITPRISEPTVADVSMILGTTTPAVTQLAPGGQQHWMMNNIRTWVDLPASALGLQDLTTALDLNNDTRLGLGRSVQPLPPSFAIDSFFDVFTEISLGPTTNTGPQFESLLYGEVQLQNFVGGQPTGDPVTYLRFWNLNAQSPEPGTLVLLVGAGLGLLARRRRSA